MTTYYRNGQGRVFSAMPWRFVDYWSMTHDPDLRDYRQTRPEKATGHETSWFRERSGFRNQRQTTFEIA